MSTAQHSYQRSTEAITLWPRVFIADLLRREHQQQQVVQWMLRWAGTQPKQRTEDAQV